MKNKIIGLYGVFATGKSFLAHGLSSKFWNYDTVTTDNLLAIARSLNTNDPYLQQSSYTAWKVLGDNSLENIIEGFKQYRERLQPFIKIILDRAYKERTDMIIEGIHISAETFLEYETLLDTKLVLITIKDKEIHWKRVIQKCINREALFERITPYFDVVRTLQDFLIEEATKYNVLIVDNGGDKEDTLKKILENVK
jgi:2-phosphoglycerate kinase